MGLCGECHSSTSTSTSTMPPKKQQRGRLTEAEVAERSCSLCGDPVPGAYTWLVEYPAAAGEPHAACKAEHLILHQWDFAMNSANNADYAWEQLRATWPQQLGDVHSLRGCDSSSSSPRGSKEVRDNFQSGRARNAR